MSALDPLSVFGLDSDESEGDSSSSSSPRRQRAPVSIPNQSKGVPKLGISDKHSKDTKVHHLSNDEKGTHPSQPSLVKSDHPTPTTARHSEPKKQAQQQRKGVLTFDSLKRHGYKTPKQADAHLLQGNEYSYAWGNGKRDNREASAEDPDADADRQRTRPRLQ